ncbi:unnamed protein product [Sphagnum balticum]
MSTPTSPTTKYIFVTKRAILEDYESLLTDLRVLCNDTEDLSEEYVALWRKHQSDPGLNQVFVNVRLYDADETWTEIASRLYDLETRLKKEARVVSKLPEGTMDDEVGENLVKSFNKLIDEYNAGLRDLKIRGRNMVKLRMGLPSPRSSPEPESERSRPSEFDYRSIRLPGFSKDPQKLVGGVSYSTETRKIRITRKELRKLKKIRAKTPAGSSSLDRYDDMPKGSSKCLARNLARDVLKAKAKLAREREEATD